MMELLRFDRAETIRVARRINLIKEFDVEKISIWF